MSTRIVCLCDQFDLKAEFGSGFTLAAPWIEVLRPDEVDEPEAIRHAMVFRPGPTAFEAYPNLRLLCSIGAGVYGRGSHPGLREGMIITRLTTPDVAQMMAAYALWHVIGWQRRLRSYAAQQEAGIWQ